MPSPSGAPEFDTFLLRSAAAGGMVAGIGGSASGSLLVPQRLGAGGIDAQLFRGVTTSTGVWGQLVHVASGLAVAWQSLAPGLTVETSDPTSPRQRWRFDGEGRIFSQNTDVAAVTMTTDGFSLQHTGIGSAQIFEMFDPTDFIMVRNSWSGQYMTGNDDSTVSWGPLQGGSSDSQMWGLTETGALVNRGSGDVLQGPAGASSQVPLTLGTATASDDPAHVLQQFDLMSMDGSASWLGATGFVLGTSGAAAVLEPADPTNSEQIVEPISPYQFFGLENQGSIDGSPPWGYQPWLARNGASATLMRTPDWSPTCMFTVSRYGELISQVDGFVLQSAPQGTPVSFVDPAPEPIGFDSTTFSYVPTNASWGAIELRASAPMGLLIAPLGTDFAPTMGLLSLPADGNQAWALTPQPGNPFSTDVDIARHFFANPVPLPGTGDTLAVHYPGQTEELLQADLDKTVKVIGTLVLGFLDIAAGWTPTVAVSKAIDTIAKIVLGNSDTAARVAVVMQGTVTAASIVAVADGITKAGLWWKILELVVPNSFWGWALTIAKLAVKLLPVGWALTTAQLAILAANVAVIIGDGAEDEVAVLNAHVQRLQADSL